MRKSNRIQIAAFTLLLLTTSLFLLKLFKNSSSPKESSIVSEHVTTEPQKPTISIDDLLIHPSVDSRLEFTKLTEEKVPVTGIEQEIKLRLDKMFSKPNEILSDFEQPKINDPGK